ncbi:MAG: hypothetical protein Q9227_000147 [Pyrenula ochraceoflavens]
MVSTKTSSLAGKNAVVTGGSRGIGAGIVRELARRGANVAIHYNTESGRVLTESLIRELHKIYNVKATGISGDLSNIADSSVVRQIVSDAVQAFDGGIDILVNNAGISVASTLTDFSIDSLLDVYSLNTFAPMLLVQALLPHMRRPGRVIDIGSGLARVALSPSFLLYSGAKSALEAVTRVLALTLGEYGTTVNCVSVGIVSTEATARASESLMERMRSITPIGNRLGEVEDIAMVVGFLASEDGRWITGQTISASGGAIMI